MDALLDPLTKLGVLVEQLAEERLVHRQQADGRHRLHARHPRRAEVQRQLSEEVAGPQELGVALLRARSLEDPQASLLDDE